MRKREIALLRFDLRVDQEEYVLQVFTFGQVSAHVTIECILLGFRESRISVAGEVHQRPRIIDREEIDPLRFTRLARGVRELSWRSVSMLINEDLPTFERPMKANSGRLEEGQSSSTLSARPEFCRNDFHDAAEENACLPSSKQWNALPTRALCQRILTMARSEKARS